MKDQQGKNTCAHPSCTCAPREHSKYCSQYCEDAKETTELSCNCGHPGCGVETLSETQTGDLTTA